MKNYTVKKYLHHKNLHTRYVVIVCEQYDKNSGRQSETEYRVRLYYHYEWEENRDNRCLFDETTTNKDVANNLFKSAVRICESDVYYKNKI